MALRRLSFQQHIQGDQQYTPCGAMDQRITLLTLGDRPADGGDAPSVPFTDSWANISDLFAQQIREGQQIVKQVTKLIRMPYQEGIDESMQVQFGEQIWQIVGIEQPDQQNREMRILCISRDQNA